MSGDAQLLGNILLDAGRTDAAAKQFWQALDVVEKSSLSDEVKQDTRLADHYNDARVALAKGDLPKAKTEAQAYAGGRRGAARTPSACGRRTSSMGSIALAEKQYDDGASRTSARPTSRIRR